MCIIPSPSPQEWVLPLSHNKFFMRLTQQNRLCQQILHNKYIENPMQVQQKRLLKLNFFGNIRTLDCQPAFKLQQLQEFCTLGEVFESGPEIYAKVKTLKKPYSELCSSLATLQA